jgi:hypothetical protein
VRGSSFLVLLRARQPTNSFNPSRWLLQCFHTSGQPSIARSNALAIRLKPRCAKSRLGRSGPMDQFAQGMYAPLQVSRVLLTHFQRAWNIRHRMILASRPSRRSRRRCKLQLRLRMFLWSPYKIPKLWRLPVTPGRVASNDEALKLVNQLQLWKALHPMLPSLTRTSRAFSNRGVWTALRSPHYHLTIYLWAATHQSGSAWTALR